MYNPIRQIHLFSALVLTTFVLMYFITGWVMVFEETFKRQKTATETIKKIVPGIHTTGNDTIISLIKHNFNLSGQYQVQRNASGEININFRHPGWHITAAVKQESDSVTVTVEKQNFVSVMHQFHRLHGYRGGWNYYAWALMFDLSSVSMILFAITGVYLWYRVERQRLAGWIVLVAMTGLTAFTIFYLMYLA